jgi:protein-S-isoprenylcysteine O-methyltransferase Ste14
VTGRHGARRCSEQAAPTTVTAMKETAYLLQAALVVAWWIALSASERFFAAFQFAQIPPVAFWSFLAPDVLLVGVLSAVRAYRRAQWLEWTILGAFAYATFYCANAAVLTRSGGLPTSLMAMGLAYNVFLCWDKALFRNATSGTAANACKTVVQIVCIWFLALAVIPYVLLDAFPPAPGPRSIVWTAASVGLFAAASALGLASSFFFVRDGAGTPLLLDQSNALVVTGPYRCVRNPMAIAGIAQGLAVGMYWRSAPIVAYALLGAVVWHVVVRPVEERDMERRFGAAYEDYRRRVACWIPAGVRRGR